MKKLYQIPDIRLADFFLQHTLILYLRSMAPLSSLNKLIGLIPVTRAYTLAELHWIWIPEKVSTVRS